jgi:cyclic-di-AMP phosphodiesterase PgpH
MAIWEVMYMEKWKRILYFMRTFKHEHFLKTSLYMLFALVLFLSMYSNIRPEKLDLKLYSSAEKTIVSPGTIADPFQTQEKRKAASDQVKDVYTLKKDYAQNQVDLIDALFKAINEVDIEIAKEFNETNSNESATEDTIYEKTRTELTFSEKMERLSKKLPEEVKIHKELSKSTLVALFDANLKQRIVARDNAVTAVNNIMANRIEIQGIDAAREKVNDELRYINVPESLKKATIDFCKYVIIPNVVFDKEATEAKKQAEMEAVEPVYILQGEIIVKEGDKINSDDYRKLGLAGFLTNKDTSLPYLGLTLIILLLLSSVYFYFKDDEQQKLRYLTIYVLVCSITIMLMKIISLFQKMNYSAEIGFVVPVAMGAILIKLLLNERVAILASMLFAICGSIIFNGGISSTFNFSIGIYFLVGCITAILFLGKHNLRSQILQAGLLVGFINIILLLAIIMLKNGHLVSLETTPFFIMALLSGIISAVLAIGLMPFFEAGFGILSTMRLIELSNPNHPLLRKILTETPGTYHHSVMVANLSDAASEAIGANGFLARVGAYYHDIGKTRRPQFFIENQMNRENPHDKISPHLSKTIIISHVTDGVEMLKQNKIPKEIIDIAEQHHGTTLLKYFYHRASDNNEKEINESEFRYPGPKAQSKEAAIIGIADSVEAAVRSMTNPSPQKIESIVKNIITDRLQDGQLDECDLTMRELDVISKSFCETMKGIFHSRIEYPELTKQKVKEA